MKRIIATLIALSLVPLCADAQWYLFPGSRKNPAQEQEPSELQGRESNTTTRRQEQPREEEQSRRSTRTRFGRTVRPSDINVALALPLRASSDNPNGSMLDLYSGALMAVRDLGNQGIRVNLRVIDSSTERIDDRVLSSNDLVIGPVSYEDVLSVSALCSRGEFIVSPLDPKTAELVGDRNVIQAPSTWKSQIDELVEWLQEDLNPGDELIVIKDDSQAGDGEQRSYLLDRLGRKLLNYRAVASFDRISFDRNTTYRILIASDSDSFITGTVRSIAIGSKRRNSPEIILYSTSRIRSTIGSNTDELYSAKTHLTASYHIDYDSPAVKNFILAYRALFKGEPDSFAFQGYDIMHYFLTVCALYGEDWPYCLDRYSESGLQSDFSFNSLNGDGMANVAVRRVIYNNDLTTTLAK